MENQAKQALEGQETEKAALLSPLPAHGLRPRIADGLPEPGVWGIQTQPAARILEARRAGPGPELTPADGGAKGGRGELMRGRHTD